MRTFKFNIDEPIIMELYNGGLKYAKYKAILKTIKCEKGKRDRIIFEEVPIINAPMPEL
jgi:hypothetical protein